jgi:phospholipase C
MHPLTRARRATAGAIAVLAGTLAALAPASGTSAVSAFPHYDHVFLLIDENHGSNTIIGNPAAPEINALASDYGLATSYTGVADPSEPNYVAMLGGSTFGISSDDPYFFPGQSVSAPNLMSQMEQAGLSWKGYFQDMPYAGYRGYCYPAKCNGIPDSDTEYVAKHNGIVNFANMQTRPSSPSSTPSSSSRPTSHPATSPTSATSCRTSATICTGHPRGASTPASRATSATPGSLPGATRSSAGP